MVAKGNVGGNYIPERQWWSGDEASRIQKTLHGHFQQGTTENNDGWMHGDKSNMESRIWYIRLHWEKGSGD